MYWESAKILEKGSLEEGETAGRGRERERKKGEESELVEWKLR